VEVNLPTPNSSELSGYLQAQGAKLASAGVHLAVGDATASNAFDSSATDSTSAAPEPALAQATAPAPAPGSATTAPAAEDTEVNAAAAAPGAAPDNEGEQASTTPADSVPVAASGDGAELAAERKEAERLATSATAATLAAAEAAIKAQAAARTSRDSRSQLARDAELASQEAAEHRATAVKASGEAATAAQQAQHAPSLREASAAREEAFGAADRATHAAAAAKQAQKRAEDCAQKAKPVGIFSPTESDALWLVHKAGLLLESTPRDLKRMMNRYQLAKYICTEQVRHWRSPGLPALNRHTCCALIDMLLHQARSAITYRRH
jgi:hypothetical protein